MAPIRVMTVDDHPIYRDGLAALLALHDDLALVAEAATGVEAIAKYRVHQPDVTLMDLSMPELEGAPAIEAITAEFPEARIIALTTYEGDADIFRALKAGARGYLLKDIVRTALADAIRTVHRGGRAVPGDVAQRLATFTPRVDLTPRELEVLELMGTGARNRDIADAIGRTEATAKVHVAHIMEKLGAKDRTEAIAIAFRRGIIRVG